MILFAYKDQSLFWLLDQIFPNETSTLFMHFMHIRSFLLQTFFNTQLTRNKKAIRHAVACAEITDRKSKRFSKTLPKVLKDIFNTNTTKSGI